MEYRFCTDPAPSTLPCEFSTNPFSVVELPAAPSLNGRGAGSTFTDT
jgi:hypothetical protein